MSRSATQTSARSAGAQTKAVNRTQGAQGAQGRPAVAAAPGKDNGPCRSGEPQANAARASTTATYPLPPHSPSRVGPPLVTPTSTQNTAMLSGESNATGARGSQRENRRPPRREDCRDFLRGVCRKGDKCPRIHPELPSKQSTDGPLFSAAATPRDPSRSNLGQTQPTDIYSDQPHVPSPLQPHDGNGLSTSPDSRRNDENVAPPNSRHVAPVKKINEVCRKNVKGTCTYGDRCFRIHEPLNAPTAPPQPSSSKIEHVPTPTPAPQPAQQPKAANKAVVGKPQASAEPKPSAPTQSTSKAAQSVPTPAPLTSQTPKPAAEAIVKPKASVEPKPSTPAQSSSKTSPFSTPAPPKAAVGPAQASVKSQAKEEIKQSRHPKAPVAAVSAAPGTAGACHKFRRGQCHKDPCPYYHPPPAAPSTSSAATASPAAAGPSVTAASKGKAPEKAAPPTAGALANSTPKSPQESPEKASRTPAPPVVPEQDAKSRVVPVGGAVVARETPEKDQDSYDRSSDDAPKRRSKPGRGFLIRRAARAAAKAESRAAANRAGIVAPTVMTVDSDDANDATGVGAIATVKVPHTSHRQAPFPTSESAALSVLNQSIPVMSAGSSRSAAAAQRQHAGSDLESDSTDYVSFSSPGSSTRVSADSSFSSAPPNEVRKSQVCLDWLHGRCHREHCRYAHTDDFGERPQKFGDLSPRQSERLRLQDSTAAGPAQSLDGCARCRAGQCNGKHKFPETRVSPQPSVSEPAMSSVPLVPPGLGLEARIRNGVVLKEVPQDASNAPPSVQPRREPPETISLTVLDATKVTFGPGFEVQQLMTGFESRQIIIDNVPPHIKPVAITDALSAFGEVLTVHVPERLSSTERPQQKKGSAMFVRVTFAKQEEAALAVSTLDGARLFDRTVSVRLSTFKSTSVGKGVLSDADVFMEFPAPVKTCYVGYKTKEQALEVIRLANGTVLRDCWVTADIFTQLPKVSKLTVRFQGIPGDMVAEEFKQYGENDGVMMEVPAYVSTRSALDGLRSELQRYGELVSFTPVPPPYKGNVRVWARFSLASTAEEVCRALHNRGHRRFGDYKTHRNNKLFARHIKNVTYTLPAHVYDALSDDIHLLRLFVYDHGHGDSIAVMNRSLMNGARTVKIKISSEDMQSLTRIKTDFERLLRGEQLVKSGEILWHEFFGRLSGISYLQNVERSYGVMINRDPRRRTLALFGPGPKRAAVREVLIAKIVSLRAKTSRVFHMEQRIIGLFMTTEMVKLQQEYGEEAISIDVWRRTLHVLGDADTFRMTKSALERTTLRKLHEREPGHEGENHEAECPVCFDEVAAPVTLKCGHAWCKSCLANYLLAAIDTKVFPLKCLGAEARCTHCIPLSAAQEVLSPNDFNRVVRAALLAYVHARPKEFHYCPTPDCPQVYRHAAPDTVLQCPSCFVRICPYCHCEAHDTENCPDRDTEDTRMFEQWKTGHDVKSCPGCKAPIERAQGCNHMTCTRCQTHICWVCLAMYTKSQDVYDHMHSVHGGIGL